MSEKIHEHIIRVSTDPRDGITRDQLWAGIEEFVRFPHRFIEHMRSSKVLDEVQKDGETVLSREIDFDQFKLNDTVTLTPGQRALTSVKGNKQWPGSSFLIQVEEPEANSLFLRFVYEQDGALTEENPQMLALRRKAYEAKDRAFVDQLLAKVK